MALSALVLLAGGGWAAWQLLGSAPGTSFEGEPPPLTAPQLSLAERLERDVTRLSVGIGQRSPYRPDALAAAADVVDQRLTALGLSMERLPVEHQGRRYDVVAGRRLGSARPAELVVVGAHYDAAPGSPGANSNASGVAVMLALAEALAETTAARTLVFAGFPLGTPAYQQTEAMGSLAYARELDDQGLTVTAMLSLDSLGYYSEEPDSQRLPAPVAPFYPSVGNYVAIAGDLESAVLTRAVTALFREHASVPSESGVGPGDWDGIGWSDHWGFWQLGWPAVVVSDTALYRDPEYQRPGDLPGRLDYATMARVTEALAAVVTALADS